MADKIVLGEGVIRKIMGMADINPTLTSNFLKENEMSEDELGDEDLLLGDDEELDDEDLAPVGDEDLIDDDPGEEAPLEGGDKESKFAELVQMLADLVGVDVELGDDVGGEEMPPPVDDVGGEEMSPVDDGDDDGVLDENDEYEYMDESQLQEAVAKKVTERLKKIVASKRSRKRSRK